MKFSLVEFSLHRPVTVCMISLCALVIGIIAWNMTPLQFLPRVDRPFIGVSIPYPGASPEQVEQQIAVPVEGQFRTIPGVRQIRTISNSDGCFVSMLFDLDTDMTLATVEVRDRIERLKLVLPQEVDRVFIQRFSSRSIPVVAFGVFNDEDPEEFVHRVRTILSPRIRRLEGVAEVQVITPIPERSVLIEFDQDRLKALQLALAEVVGYLRQSNINVSVGQLTDGRTQYYVRVLGEYRKLEHIENLLVSPTGLRVKDVATVRYAPREEAGVISLDGKAGAVVLVRKESEANTVRTCQSVRSELEKILTEPLFQGSETKVFFDQSELILSALRNLRNSGLYGAVMALVVLFLFLHRVRPTIIVALAIPTSLMVALIFIFFAGMSLNIITMVSMIISVGMLVDNAIVVVENIVRLRSEGKSVYNSVKEGANGVSLAILASTATTWVVFLPMYFMQTGRMSIFMEQLGLPLMVALGGSLLLAVTLVPLAMSLMVREGESNIFARLTARNGRGGSRNALGRVLGAFANLHLIRRFIDAFAFLVHVSLRWRLASLLILVGAVALTLLVPYPRVGMRDMPRLDTREVKIEVKLDQNYDLTMAKELFENIAQHINRWREELAIKNVLTFYDRTGGMFELYLYTADDGPLGENPPYDTEQVMRIVSARLPALLPGAELEFSVADAGDEGAGSTVSVQLEGENRALLTQYAEQFRRGMESISLIHDVQTDEQKPASEVRVNIDEVLAQQAGVSPLVIAQTIDAALRGARLPYLKQGGKEIPVWAQFRESDRRSRANLENLEVITLNRGLVPLNRLVDYERSTSPLTIHRVNGKNVVTFTAKANTKDLSAVNSALQTVIDRFDLPPGYRIRLGQQLEDLGETMLNFTFTLVMAVILIYIVMAALFESYVLPLSILTTVPIALGGGVWMLYFVGGQMDTVTLIGNILLCGVIVNNGIVLVDHINQLRAHYPDRTAAIVQASRDRWRPVMMTALTTILGLVPLALAKTGGAATFAGLGQSLVGGLSLGTILTLVVVPLFYSLFDDFQQWVAAFLRSFTAGREKAAVNSQP